MYVKPTRQCEVCKATHRVIAWRLPAGGFKDLCLVCAVALRELGRWRNARTETSLETLLAELPAFLSAPANHVETVEKTTA